MKSITDVIPLNGRLVVVAIQSEDIDIAMGIEIAADPHDTRLATIVKTFDPDKYPEGGTVMYDRIHGSDITLLDENGDPCDYKVVMVADLSLMFTK